jgi:hypothetical protein
VIRLLKAAPGLKYKAAFGVAYGAGRSNRNKLDAEIGPTALSSARKMLCPSASGMRQSRPGSTAIFKSPSRAQAEICPSFPRFPP